MNTDTKTLLIKATRELMDQKGLDAVTLRSVGSQVNLSRSAVYRHFKNKEALLAEITKENFNQLLNEYKMPNTGETELKEVIKHRLIHLHDFGVKHKVQYQLMFATSWENEEFPELHTYANALFEQTNEIIKRLLSSQGLDTNASIQKTAITYAFIHGLIELHIAGHFESSKYLDKTDHLICDLLNMITAK